MSGGLTALLLPTDAVLGLESRCPAQSRDFTSSLSTAGGRIPPLHDHGGDMRDSSHLALLPPAELGDGVTPRASPLVPLPWESSTKNNFYHDQGMVVEASKHPQRRTHPNKADLDRRN